MITLYEHSEKRIGEILRFEAKIHGATLKEPPRETVKTTAKLKNLFEFGDPDAYSKMTQAEREALTKQMMNRHKTWVQKKQPMGGKQARMG